MIIKTLYDLLFDADRNSHPGDLDRIAFLLDCIPDLQWLKEAIREDMPRLAALLEPPGPPQVMFRALLYCEHYVNDGGTTGSVASLFCNERGWHLVSDEDLAALAAHRSKRKTN